MDGVDDDGLAEFKPERAAAQSPVADLDGVDAPDSFELPGAELVTDEELTVPVVPMLSDEFRCYRCFLVRHKSQRAAEGSGVEICHECA